MLIQFWADEYTGHNQSGTLKTCMDTYFGKIEFVVDERGHKEVVSKNPLVLKDVPNDIRFVLLRGPISRIA